MLIIIVLIGICARYIRFNNPAMVLDSVVFSRLGKNLIEFGKYSFGENYNMGVFFPPGYPVFIGILDLLIGDLFVSAKLVSFISSSLTIVLSYFIGKELHSKEAGLFAAFAYALYPVILILSVDAYSDVLFFFFLLLSLYMFIRSLRDASLIVNTLFGLSAAGAYLTRPEGQFLLLLPLARVFGLFRESRPFHKKNVYRAVFVFIIFAVVISPYMVFLKNYTGKFSSTGKANISILLGELSNDKEYHEVVNAPDNLYDKAAFALTDDKRELKGWNRKENLSLKDYLLKDPVTFLKRYQKNVLRETKTVIKLLLPILIPLLFAFLVKDLFRNRARLIFMLLPMLFFFMYPMFIIIEKQTLLIVVFLIFIASIGFTISKESSFDILRYYGLFDNRILNFVAKNIKIVIVAMLILSSLSYIKYSSFDKTPKPVEHDQAGLYIKEKVRPGYEEINIMSAKPYVSYFSDSRFTMLPYAKSRDVIVFAKQYSVDFIVIDERFLSMWDHYDELIEMHIFSEDVELFYEYRADKLIRLFRIK